jgi:hypothetical protein
MYESNLYEIRNRVGSVSIATGSGLEYPGTITDIENNFSFPLIPSRLWGPPNLQSNGYRGAVSPRLKRPEPEAGTSPSSAEVENDGAISPIPILPHGIMLN